MSENTETPETAIAPSWVEDTARVLLAGVDTVYFNFDVEIGDVVWDRLHEEQEEAKRMYTTRKADHCPEWLGACLRPTGAKGGYRFLIERADEWSIKLLRGVPNRPTMCVEMRSFGLHTNEGGVVSALYAVLGYIGEVLLSDMRPEDVLKLVNLDTARCSRLDLHVDWQGGWQPTYATGEDRLFLKPGRVKWKPEMEGNTCTGYVFGRDQVMARIYNKTLQTEGKHLDWYHELLVAHNGTAYDPEQTVWRLEYQLKRDGMKSFKLYAEPEVDDDDEVIAAEMAGEDLPHVASVRKALHWAAHIWDYLSSRWLRLVAPTDDANRARWPVHPTWQALQAGFAPAMQGGPLPPEKVQLVRKHRHTGYERRRHRMQVGVLTTFDTLDTDCAALGVAWLAHLRHVAEVAARWQNRRFDRLPADDQLIDEMLHGMAVRYDRAEKFKQALDMILGIFTSAGVLQLGMRQVESVEELVQEVLPDLEYLAYLKGGIQQLIVDKRHKRFKIPATATVFAKAGVAA